jgi:seryl-tRNA synthetase
VHDLKIFREQLDLLRDGLRRRGALDALSPVLDRGVALEKERRTLIQAVEERKAARNANAQEVAKRKRAKEDAGDLIAQGRALGEEIGRLEGELGGVEAELQRLLLEIPNVTLPAVPGGDEEHNVVVREWGAPRAPDGVKPHWEIGADLGIIDLERASKISGSGFVVYRKAGARLVRSLLNYFMDVHRDEHGYEEVWPPLLVNRATMTGTGQLPKFEDDAYATRGDELFLIPTAEVPVTNLYRGEILDGATLTQSFCSYSPCFRAEAGAAGRDTRGMIRQHQFTKVELVSITTPEASKDEHERMLACAEEVLRQLDLHYRVMTLCAGDMGFSSQKTYDIEVWMPGQGEGGAFREISSCSVCGDFQARRMDARSRGPDGKPRFVHTLNGSGTAVGRALIAVMETYQQEDGSIAVPDVLQPYMGGLKVIARE